MTFGVFALFGAFAPSLQADDTPFKSTPYPVPRFVSIGSGKVYVRTGPGKKYPIKWGIEKKGLPVEIVLEYEHWRKIKDPSGDQGWVHSSLLSGNRTGVLAGEGRASLMQKPKEGARTIAYLEPGTLFSIEECNKIWCEVNASGYKGWIQQQRIWGVYPNEEF